MTGESVSKRTYPWTASVDGKQIALRLMGAGDRDEVLSFAQSLPEDDLLFLSIDITQPEAVDQWVESLKAGRNYTVLAEADGRLVGHGTLYRSELHWMRHLGEIQLLLSPEVRGRGLGKILANELFALAQELGLQKIVARMAYEQRGAKQVFERLGFRAEALLADYVVDRNDRTHDLVVMSYDVTGLTE